MKTLILILLATSLNGQNTVRDLLKTNDDAAHVYASIGTMCISSEIAHVINDDITKSLIVGLTVTAAVGVAKEVIWDKLLKRGVFSYWDLFNDAWGMFIGFLVERVIMDVKGYKRHDIQVDYFDDQIIIKKAPKKWSLKRQGFLN